MDTFRRSGSVAVGDVLAAEVPVGTDIDVQADGELVGSVRGDGPTVYVYFSGPGCPATATG
ncbi:hypothetical protein [Kineococcus sp. SYSU DK004]|uniref:hypothetical protein n=1 Tax=Kineococcus sp. SYSU DK004 TaxID=3383125 RepID=UPI003D7EF36E